MSSRPTNAEVVAEHVYSDAQGQPVGKAVRREWIETNPSGQAERAKDFKLYRYEGGKYIAGLAGRQFPLYMLPRTLKIAAEHGAIFLVEGEKCADRMNAEFAKRKIAAVATTLAKGCGTKLSDEDLEAFCGAKQVIVLPDADDEGRDAAQKRAMLVRTVVDDVRIVEVYPERIDGSDIVDWLDEENTFEKLRDLVAQAKHIQPYADTPLEWPDERQMPWPVMGKAAYYGLSGAIVRALAPETEADPVALQLTLLVAFGAAVGPSSYIIVDGARHPARIWTILLGGSSTGRKGTSLAVIEHVLRAADDEWYDAARRSGFGSGEGLVADLAGELDKLPSPYQGNAFVIEPEYYRVLEIGSKPGNTLSYVLRDAWDGSPLSTIRRSARVSVKGAHVGLLGHGVPEVLREQLTQAEVYGGGANRCLYAYIRRSQRLPSGGYLDPILIASLGKRLRNAIDFGRQGRQMKRTPQAEALWKKIYLSEPEVDGVLGAFTARGPAQMLRLAVAYALLDSCDEIDVPHLLAARAIWLYCVASVSRMISDGLTSDEQKLVNALREVAPKPLAARDIDRLFSGHQGAQDRARMLEKLVDRRLVVVDESTLGAGRRSLFVRALSCADVSGLSGFSSESPAFNPLNPLIPHQSVDDGVEWL